MPALRILPLPLPPPAPAPPGQSLFLAPLFVWFELLFLLGYRRQLRSQVEARVARSIADWRAGSGRAD